MQARLAAILLTAMYASVTLLVHGPMLLADPSSHMIWSEKALALRRWWLLRVLRRPMLWLLPLRLACRATLLSSAVAAGLCTLAAALLLHLSAWCRDLGQWNRRCHM